MQDIKYRELKMQEKRKHTEWRESVQQIASWLPFLWHKRNRLISRYPLGSRIRSVVSSEDFNMADHSQSDIPYNREQDFFYSINILFANIDFPNLLVYPGNEECRYSDSIFGCKRVYLGNTIGGSKNVAYSYNVKENNIDVYNSSVVQNNCNTIYFSIGVTNSYNVFYSKYIINCSDIRFSKNLLACKECVFCEGLENKNYCIYNKQYQEAEYYIEKDRLLKEGKDFFLEHYQEMTQSGKNFGNTNVNGSFVLNSENVENGYFCFQNKNTRNVWTVLGSGVNENIYDCFNSGEVASSDFYGVISSGVNCENVYNSMHIAIGSSNIYYSMFMISCSYCLGCIGLKNKSFCILNKQYSKEERFEKANEIFAQMEKDGTLGAFFPGWMNPFYFNDTAAYLIDDTFTKEEVEKDGYLRRDEEIKVDVPGGAEVITTDQLKEYQGFDEKGERKINPEILKKVIKDDKGNYYRIVPMELEFLQKYGLPLPEIHWLERIKLGFKFK